MPTDASAESSGVGSTALGPRASVSLLVSSRHRARSQRSDLVLTDIQLPVLDDYDATQQINALPDLSAIPIMSTLATVPEQRFLSPCASGHSDHESDTLSCWQKVLSARCHKGDGP
jgi:CheY-like chemotaxis protein